MEIKLIRLRLTWLVFFRATTTGVVFLATPMCRVLTKVWFNANRREGGGAKAPSLSFDTVRGTTEVMPCYKALRESCCDRFFSSLTGVGN